MKTANSRIVLNGELDISSLNHAFAWIPTESLKLSAQKMREHKDWYGLNVNEYQIYNAMLYVIRVVEPKFDTEFIPCN
jgi:hypothetical protein